MKNGIPRAGIGEAVKSAESYASTEISSSRVHGIVRNNNGIISGQIQAHRNSKGVNLSDKEQAVATILLEIANADAPANGAEIHIILSSLQRLFGTTHERGVKIVNQSKAVLQNIRSSPEKFIIAKELSDGEKEILSLTIDELIKASETDDPVQIFYKNRLLQEIS